MAEDKPPEFSRAVTLEEPAPVEKSPEHQPITFGEVSALFGFLAAAVFPVGLVTSWVPLARTYTGDYSTAWYAVSLIPKTTVIGQGMLLIAGPLLLSLVFTPLVTLWFVIEFIFAEGIREGIRSSRKTLVFTLVGAAIIEIIIVFLIIRFERVLPSSGFLEKMFLFFGPGAVMWTVILGSSGGINQRWPKGVSARAVWRIGVFSGLVVLVVVAAAIGAFRGQPPLPPVHVAAKDVAANSSIDGDLLAHVDGFWYVFDEQNILVAIPDDEVTEVRITEGE